MINIRTNAFYYLQYTFLIIAFFFFFSFNSQKVTISQEVETRNEIGNQHVIRTKSNINARPLYREEAVCDDGGVNMSKKNAFDKVEEELYALIGQIDYGEISDIDVDWASLASSLLEIETRNWDKPDPKTNKKVSDILKSMPYDFIGSELIDLTLEMEKLSEGRTTQSIDDESLDELQSHTIDFEVLFTDFLKKLRESDDL